MHFFAPKTGWKPLQDAAHWPQPYPWRFAPKELRHLPSILVRRLEALPLELEPAAPVTRSPRPVERALAVVGLLLLAAAAAATTWFVFAG